MLSSERFKRSVLRLPPFRRGWRSFKEWQLHRTYEVRREFYHREATRRRLRYSASQTTQDVRSRLHCRGYSPPKRRLGEVHTFAFVAGMAWHDTLFPDLEELGPVSRYDYVSRGYDLRAFQRADAKAIDLRRRMNQELLEAVRMANQRRPVDWVFVYANGYELLSETIRRMIHELGVPVVGMCLDDKHSWAGELLGGQRTGQVDLVKALDLCYTSALVTCEWYLVEGGRPLFMPEGFCSRTFRPAPLPRDIPISFIGGCYGFRPDLIQHLRSMGAPIEVYGSGWGSGYLSLEEQVAILNRSKINLGMGGIGYSESLSNLKGRDFEVPGTGGGVYLTSYSADLAQQFRIGEEILCYGNHAELIELVRYYLSRPDEADMIARRGRARCLAEHRWLHRYKRLCEVLGILDPGTEPLAPGERTDPGSYPTT